MKVKLIRQSLTPIEDDVNAEMMTEYQELYDKLMELHGTDMQTMHVELEKMIDNLRESYKDKLHTEMELPKTGKAWKELLNTYGAVMIGTDIDTGKLTLVVMDENEQRGVAE